MSDMEASGRAPSSGRTGQAPRRPAGLRRLFAMLPRKLQLAIYCAALAFIVASLGISGALIYYTVKIPNPMAFRAGGSGPLVRLLDRNGAVLAERGKAYQYIPLVMLNQRVIEAVVATEDRRFFDHGGLDPLGILRAMFVNLRAGRFIQGGSTISQQLAKNLFLSSDRTLGRKLEELLLALWLEVRLSKEEILELYLNRVYFGAGAYGIEAAAQLYFGKTAGRLSIPESAVLAGLLKAPSKYSPMTNPGLARSRARVVISRMRDAGFITSDMAADASRHSVRFANRGDERTPTGLEHAVEYALERLPPLVGSGHNEIIVETTLDISLQRRSQAAVAAALSGASEKDGPDQAAAIVLDPDGEIHALIGGRNWTQSQYNRAVSARRQPGSAFKPFVYLAAVEQGATPDTQVEDRPISVDGWSPRNDDGRYRGTVTLQAALAHSLNSVAVRLQQDVTTGRVIGTAARLGIRSLMRSDPTLALGTSEVSLLELTGAYAVLASGGLAVGPHIIRRVRSNTGAVLYERPMRRPRMIVTPEHAGIMSQMLNAAMVSGTGRRAALAGHVAAGKTGTTQDNRDAWFIGYTAHLTAGVWVGNDNARPMQRVTGGGIPALLWHAIMKTAHERLPAAPIPGLNVIAPPPVARPPPAVDPIAALMQAPPARASLARARKPLPRRKQAAKEPVAAAAALPRLPDKPIDAEFVARALAATSKEQPPAKRQARSLWGLMGLGVPAEAR
ncbi:MAG: PBP1A family penicillin-binding protein [Hyphomicrobiaceae bacterium]